MWMDGNLTRAGITADLEAMRAAGLGGVVICEVNVGVPRGPVEFMSPEWRVLFKHVVREAERLGLEVTLNAGPGWTGSGGPWVGPLHGSVLFHDPLPPAKLSTSPFGTPRKTGRPFTLTSTGFPAGAMAGASSSEKAATLSALTSKAPAFCVPSTRARVKPRSIRSMRSQ
ncbi:MAG: hypothetical protein HGA24_11645 [Candidatus Aminicenantes bacterium]|nr:hypothetical protein [Candidatus Aminicenantes bacterium]